MSTSTSRRRAFSVLELLLALVIVGALAALVLAKFGRAKESTYLAALKSDLKSFATAQELALDRDGRYALNPTALAGFRFSPDVAPMAYTVAADHWAMILKHRKTETLCRLAMGTQAQPDAGRIACGVGLSLDIETSDEAPALGAPVTFDVGGSLTGVVMASAPTGAAARGGLLVPALLAEVPAGTAVRQINWDFGDGSFLSGSVEAASRVTHAYTAGGGDYQVRVAVVATDGAVFNGATTVTVDGGDAGNTGGSGVSWGEYNLPPTASFTLSAAAIDQGQSVTADASASVDPDGQIAAYGWTLSDGRTGTGPRLAIPFTAAGTFTVTLTVTDAQGASALLAKTVAVRATNQPPTAVAAVSGTTRAIGRPLTFSAAGSADPNGDPLTYRWAFSTGDTASGPTVTRSFAAVGPVVATLTVADPFGATATAAVSASIYANRAPTPVLTATPARANPGTPITLSAAASSDAEGSPLTATWDLDDWTTATGLTVQHTWLAAGRKVVLAAVADSDLAVARDSVIVRINAAPTARPTGPGTAFLTDTLVSFGATGSSDPDGDPLAYAWRTDDNQTAVGANAQFKFMTAGTHKVWLRATDDLGLLDSASVTVTVQARKPTAAFTVTGGLRTNGTQTFDPTGSSDRDGTIVRYQWIWGDGSADVVTTAPTVQTKVFAAQNTYQVKLVVTDDAGLADTTTRAVVIADPVLTWSLELSNNTSFTGGRNVFVSGSTVYAIGNSYIFRKVNGTWSGPVSTGIGAPSGTPRMGVMQVTGSYPRVLGGNAGTSTTTNWTTWTSAQMGPPGYCCSYAWTDAWQNGTSEAWALYGAYVSRWASGGQDASPSYHASEDLRSIHGTSASNIWVVGDYGFVARRNGTTWASVTSPAYSVTLNGVATLGPSSTWVVSATGKAYYWNGSTWTTYSVSGQALYGVYAVAADRVWAFGSAGIFYWNGTTWVLQYSTSGDAVRAMTVVNGTDFYAIAEASSGYGMRVYHGVLQ